MTPGAFPAPRPILCRGGGSWECHRYVILTTPVVSSFPTPQKKKGKRVAKMEGDARAFATVPKFAP